MVALVVCLVGLVGKVSAPRKLFCFLGFLFTLAGFTFLVFPRGPCTTASAALRCATGWSLLSGPGPANCPGVLNGIAGLNIVLPLLTVFTYWPFFETSWISSLLLN